jgi:hypothetical protein
VPGRPLSFVPKSHNPAEVRRHLAHVGDGDAAFRHARGPRHLASRNFGALLPPARPFVHLRIAADVAAIVARLTSGLPGSALAGRDSHPRER